LERERILPFRFITTNIYGTKRDKRKGISKKVNDNQTYQLQELCDGGNRKPNDTLTKVKCISGSTTSRPARIATPPVSKGGAKAQTYSHDGEGVASQQA
jgi:hypothetical protein